ncbi:hypothetical protein [Stappia sp.]|jgi:hypothetical protein|uniref:hypothetical protein n=1 Tax=Stappia sp. TaxID=1870903 RepID=UPI003D10455B
MADGRLTFDEAVEVTLSRWKGEKIRELASRFDVDPRRLYEVWQGQAHPDAVKVAHVRLTAQDPILASRIHPVHSKPKYRVLPTHSETQLDFGV